MTQLDESVLHAWWVDEGRVLAGEYPASKDDAVATRAKCELLVDLGVRTIVDLTTPEDRLDAYESTIAELADERGVTVERIGFPIPDVNVIDDEGYAPIVDLIEERSREGVVYLHCWGGVGRTGTVVGALLARQGLAYDLIIDRLTELRQGTKKAGRRCPETSAQCEVIRRLAERCVTSTRVLGAAPRGTAEQFEDCLLVGAVGDALGAQVEFASWQEIVRRHGPDGLRDLPAGTGFTDDTQMTLFTAEGLIRTSTRLRAKGITTHIDVGRYALLRWLRTQGIDADVVSPTGEPDGWLITNQLLHQRRAPGNTCLSSLASGRTGTVEERINDSKGCGAVMRMAPVGLWFAGHPDTAWEIGCDLGALTHGHDDGFEPAGAFAAIVALLAAGSPLPLAVERAIEIVRRDGTEEGEIAYRLIHALEYEGAGGVDPDDLCGALGEGWVGEEALAFAVACCVGHDDPLEALFASVNHRGDSDSTGAIAGNLLGLTHGSDWLPDGWIDRVPGSDLVRTVAQDLWTESHEPPDIEDPSSDWFRRYPGW